MNFWLWLTCTWSIMWMIPLVAGRLGVTMVAFPMRMPLEQNCKSLFNSCSNTLNYQLGNKSQDLHGHACENTVWTAQVKSCINVHKEDMKRWKSLQKTSSCRWDILLDKLSIPTVLWHFSPCCCCWPPKTCWGSRWGAFYQFDWTALPQCKHWAGSEPWKQEDMKEAVMIQWTGIRPEGSGFCIHHFKPGRTFPCRGLLALLADKSSAMNRRDV